MHEERQRLLIWPDFPTYVFIWVFFLFVEAVPGKYYALFVWNCFLEEERCNQQAICCNVWVGKAGSPPLLWMGLRGEWLVGLSGKQWPETLGEWAAFVWAVPTPALCLICCLSIKTIIWSPLHDFVNLSNGTASVEYRMYVSCVITLKMDPQTLLSTPDFLRSVNWYKPLDPALDHKNTV